MYWRSCCLLSSAPCLDGWFPDSIANTGQQSCFCLRVRSCLQICFSSDRLPSALDIACCTSSLDHSRPAPSRQYWGFSSEEDCFATGQGSGRQCNETAPRHKFHKHRRRRSPGLPGLLIAIAFLFSPWVFFSRAMSNVLMTAGSLVLLIVEIVATTLSWPPSHFEKIQNSCRKCWQ